MVYVERVAENVAHNSDAHFPVMVTVINSDSVNAFTLAGGYQYVTLGLLLRLEGEGELASVLARGIAHTALRSATREATKNEMMQLAGIPAAPLGTAGQAANGANSAIPLTTPASFSLPLNIRAKSIAGSIPAWPQTDGVTATAIDPDLKRV